MRIGQIVGALWNNYRAARQHALNLHEAEILRGSRFHNRLIPHCQEERNVACSSLLQEASSCD